MVAAQGVGAALRIVPSLNKATNDRQFTFRKVLYSEVLSQRSGAPGPP